MTKKKENIEKKSFTGAVMEIRNGNVARGGKVEDSGHVEGDVHGGTGVYCFAEAERVELDDGVNGGAAGFAGP